MVLSFDTPYYTELPQCSPNRRLRIGLICAKGPKAWLFLANVKYFVQVISEHKTCIVGVGIWDLARLYDRSTTHYTGCSGIDIIITQKFAFHYRCSTFLERSVEMTSITRAINGEYGHIVLNVVFLKHAYFIVESRISIVWVVEKWKHVSKLKKCNIYFLYKKQIPWDSK